MSDCILIMVYQQRFVKGGDNMQLSVFAELAKAGTIERVIIEKDLTDDQHRIIVNLRTVFGDELPITTRSKTPRRWKDFTHALASLKNRAGELKHVKVEIKG
ncbi:hypothetical protein A6J66_000170 [Yersinia enterocolitica]|nr:hypothetical protein A6J66_000170 [Yersinia enterocolitica]